MPGSDHMCTMGCLAVTSCVLWDAWQGPCVYYGMPSSDLICTMGVPGSDLICTMGVLGSDHICTMGCLAVTIYVLWDALQ